MAGRLIEILPKEGERLHPGGEREKGRYEKRFGEVIHPGQIDRGSAEGV